MEGTLNGGKKWASGTVTTSNTKAFEYVANTNTGTVAYLEITGLSFVPSVVVAYVGDAYSKPFIVLRPYSISNGTYYVYSAIPPATSSTSATAKSFKANSNVFVNNTTIHLPSVNTTHYTYTWYAYE